MLQATLKIPADKVATKLLTSRMHGKYCRETGESFSPVRRRLSVSSPAAAPKHGRLTHSAVCLHGYASGRDTRCHPPCTEAPNVTTNAAAVIAVLDQHHQRHQPCLYVEKHSTGKKGGSHSGCYRRDEGETRKMAAVLTQRIYTDSPHCVVRQAVGILFAGGAGLMLRSGGPAAASCVCAQPLSRRTGILCHGGAGLT